MNKWDVLIIGAGISGAVAALELSQKGYEVLLLAAGPTVWQSNSAWAQGGIVYKGEADSPDLLIRDMEEAGAGLCYREAVDQLARLGPKLVEELLIRFSKVPFDLKSNGDFSFTQEGAHTLPRILHHKDQTGLAIMRALMEKIHSAKNIHVQTGMTAVDLITLSHHSKKGTDIYYPLTCVGAYVFNQKNKQVEKILARETILATGGLGEVYLHSTNPKEARGDGIAMAFRAGARIMNLEYIQFHPTTLYVPGEGRFLLSEALRGEGARLLDARFQPFMSTYHERADLAPRDIVSRAMFSEMLRSSADHLWLDITFHTKKHLQERFPAIYAHCLEKGYDLSSEPVPVVPAAHYSCGGISVDLNGSTSIHRLRAIGEVSCTGVHGANRLASTSLLEGLVWGWTAANDISRHLAVRSDYFPPVEEWVMSGQTVDGGLIAQDWTAIKQTMWNYVGLIRSEDRLRRALKMLGQLQWEIDSFYEKAKLTPELIGLRNGVLTSTLIAQGAWRNRESRGCHYRNS